MLLFCPLAFTAATFLLFLIYRHPTPPILCSVFNFWPRATPTRIGLVEAPFADGNYALGGWRRDFLFGNFSHVELGCPIRFISLLLSSIYGFCRALRAHSGFRRALRAHSGFCWGLRAHSGFLPGLESSLRFLPGLESSLRFSSGLESSLRFFAGP